MCLPTKYSPPQKGYGIQSFVGWVERSETQHQPSIFPNPFYGDVY